MRKANGEFVKEYMKKFPALSSRKIAALLMRDMPGEFKSEDYCRGIVRYYRGARGNKDREKKGKQIIKYADLNIIHGHEYVFSISNPVNAARGLFNRAKASTLCFHHHRTSEHTETTITGKTITCWSVGCLCNLRPDYMPLNSWNHGFVEIYGDGNDGFHVDNKRIVNYRIV